MKTTLASSPSMPVAQEEISLRAREIWLARGSPEGQDVEIWLLAERELGAPSPASAKPATKAGRKNRAPSSQNNQAAPETIDVGELEDRLNSFGKSPQRSPTSLDLS